MQKEEWQIRDQRRALINFWIKKLKKINDILTK